MERLSSSGSSETAVGQLTLPAASEKRRIEGGLGFYTLLHSVDRSAADRIFRETGLKIEIPPGETVRRLDEGLGQGADGMFFLAELERESRIVGVKISRRSSGVGSTASGVPNTVHTLEEFEADSFHYEIMEVAGCGTLDRLRQMMPRLSPMLREQIVFTMAHGLFTALQGLHRKGICHDDVKPDNVMLGRDGLVRLGDFGRSHRFSEALTDGGYRGLVSYCSPESEAAALYGKTWDRQKSDVWSAGLTLLQLATLTHRVPRAAAAAESVGAPPSKITIFDQLAEIICRYTALRNPDMPSFQAEVDQVFDQVWILRDPAPDSIWGFIRHLLTFDPVDRPTPGDALDHPWMRRMYPHVDMALVGHRIGGIMIPSDLRGPQELPPLSVGCTVARNDLEERVMAAIESGRRIELVGAPGMGKTSLATAIVHRLSVRRRCYWFRDSDNLVSLTDQFLLLAREFQLDDPTSSLEELLPQIHGRMGECLVVFDNAGDIFYDHDRDLSFAAQTWKTMQFAPEQATSIFTCRSRCGYEGATSIAVGELTLQEAKSLVARLLLRDDPEVERLLSMIGRSPLAIVHACSYIGNRSLSIGAYIGNLERFMDRDSALDGRALKYSIVQMYRLTMETLSVKARHLLCAICCFVPEGIPQNAFADYREEIELLGLYSLIQFESPEHFSIHRSLWLFVMQEILGVPFGNDLCKVRWHGRESTVAIDSFDLAARIMRDAYTDDVPDQEQLQANERLIPHGVNLLLSYGYHGRLEAETQLWVLRAILDTHRPKFLGSVLRRLGKPVEGDAETTCRLLATWGAAHVQIVDYEAADAFFRRAHEEASKTLGAGHPVTLDCYEAVLQIGSGCKCAPGEIRRVVDAKIERYGGTQDVRLATTFHQVGEYLADKHRVYASAYLRRALDLRVSAFGSRHPTIIETIRSLARVVPAEQAIGMLRQAVSIGSDLHYRGDPRRFAMVIELAEMESPAELPRILWRAAEEAEGTLESAEWEGVTPSVERMVELCWKGVVRSPGTSQLLERIDDIVKRIDGGEMSALWEEHGDFLGRSSKPSMAVWAYAHCLASNNSGETVQGSILYLIYLQRLAEGDQDKAEATYRRWMEVRGLFHQSAMSQRVESDDCSHLESLPEEWIGLVKTDEDPSLGRRDLTTYAEPVPLFWKGIDASVWKRVGPLVAQRARERVGGELPAWLSSETIEAVPADLPYRFGAAPEPAEEVAEGERHPVWLDRPVPELDPGEVFAVT